MNDIERFVTSSDEDQYPQLAKAHDLLYSNLLNACIVNEFFKKTRVWQIRIIVAICTS